MKETGNKTISYVFAGENILGETTFDGVNSIQKDYINGLGTDNLVAYELDNVRYYFHKNHLGSIDGITDNSGDVVIEYEYDSFGNTYVVENGELIGVSDYSGDTFQNERLYTGREFDFEVGLYYNRARYYSPELGRFISRDPIDIADDINLYAYVGNNPVMYTDPSGEIKQLIAGATLGDYNEDGNWWSTTGQILTGFIPYYGQVADVRDFSYQWENGTKTDIIFAGIAFVPGVGDGVKALRNGLKKFPNWTNHGNKHILNSKSKWNNDIINGTKNGPAKYIPTTNIEKLEREIWETGKLVNNGKNWKVKEFKDVVGASGGKESFWIRVENSADTIHGHPITKEEFLKLTK